jgi:proteasome accessory factor C
MSSRFEHLLILLPWLHRNSGVSISDAAAEFGRSEKEFVDDLTLLTLVGVGQYAMEQFEISWHDGNIYVRDNLGLDRAFRFDAMETACLLLGLELIEQLADADHGFSEKDVASLRSKLQAALPTDPVIHVLDDDQIENLIDTIGVAVSEGRQLRFTYSNVARDDLTARTVSPLRVTAAAAEPSLQAWDHSSEAWRSFRLDRMSDVEILETAAAAPDTEFVSMPTRAVTIRVPAHRQEILEQFTLLDAPQTSSDGVTAQVAIAAPQWLARLCQAAGGAISIMAPDTIRTQVEQLVAEAVQAYR